MQVGSLVKCINGKPTGHDPKSNEIIPKKGIIYTVRAVFQTKKGTFLHLDEIINKPRQYRDEYGEVRFGIDGFRKVQPPMDVSALFEDQLKVTDGKRSRQV